MKRKNQNICLNTKFQYSEEFEIEVLGTILSNGNAISLVSNILKPEVFYNPSHQLIYTAMQNISKRGEYIDLALMSGELVKMGVLDEVGGNPYITGLTIGVTGADHNIESISKKLLEFYLSRIGYMETLKIAQKFNDPTLDVGETITELMNVCESLQQETEYSNTFIPLSTLLRDAMKRYEERKEMAAKGMQPGINTGLSVLDKYTGGFLPEQLIVLAARPGAGKTALMLHFAKTAAKHDKHVCIYSLEMSKEGLTDRIVVSESGVNSEMYRKAVLATDGENKVYKAITELDRLHVDVDVSANISIHQIKARAQQKKAKNACDIILIDYLQLISTTGENRSYNREQEIAQISRAAKIMAKELSVPVILLAQLSRKVEDRTDKRPLLSDLRESGAIEQDADMVLFIHREEYYNPAAEKGKGEIKIAKQRDGRTGTIAFGYNESLTRIFDYGTDPENTNPF